MADKEKVTCPICGEMELPEEFTDSDGALIVPVCYAPTAQMYGKLFKAVSGDSFLDATGLKVSEGMTKGMVSISHLNDEDDGREAMKAHTFTEKIECWVQK